ncbi:ATP/GTP-binding protein [Streptomyces sp. NPDC057600]|uniref:ATP/GTP-binding protein n=1 Tax=Streptomyces sp. NPDC057600 TaxID=3346180 RepID=UPI0036C1081C
MLRRAAATAVVLAGALTLTPTAHADGGGGVCEGAGMDVTVCASDDTTTPGSSGSAETGTKPVRAGGKKPTPPPCTYTKLNPQPPKNNLGWDGHTAKDGAVYQVHCPDSGRVGVTFVPNGTAGPAAPTIDPEVVARRAADAMKLTGPKVASPRAAGRYVVGMPMWMWVTRSTSSYGPATATAGGVTVTATAKVSTIRWDMGDGTAITCTGPGTPYSADRGKALSPDCGHRYERRRRRPAGRPLQGHRHRDLDRHVDSPHPQRRRHVHRDPADRVHRRGGRGTSPQLGVGGQDITVALA